MGERLKRFFRLDNLGASVPWRMFWVGLVVRVLYITLAHTYRMRVILDHFQFGWEMGRIARALVNGYGFADPFNGHSGPTAWTPPLYPLLLAGVFKLFGVYTLKSGWVILTINSVFSAATALAVYEMAWRCFGRGRDGVKIALWSGWLWALYPAAMQYAVRWVWDMALTAFLFSWVLVLALRIRGVGAQPGEATQTSRRWIAFGLLWGLIGLSNSSLMTFLPACGLWMIWPLLQGKNFAGALRNSGLGAICCLVLLSPWVVRNWFTFHAFIPMRANFGAELYESVQLSNEGFPWMATLPLAEADPQFQRYKRLGEVEYSRRQGALAIPIIRQYPGVFVKHFFTRIYFFWISVPHADDGNRLGESIRVNNFAFLSLGGILGLALAMHRRVPGAWLFFWAFTIFPFLYYLITVQARFRHPLEPIITILIVYLFQSAERPGKAKAPLSEDYTR